MKIIIFLIVIFSFSLISQSEFVPAEHPIYSFLERMSAHNIIDSYESFYKPQTRKKISEYLNLIINEESQLSEIDKNILNDYKSEFEYELFGTIEKSQSLVSSKGYKLFSNNEKYLYFYETKNKFNVFVNLIGEGELFASNYFQKKLFSPIGIAGTSIRGTILDKFGFYFKGTNGIVFSNKNNSLNKKELSYNFKLNENNDEIFFDDTEGYLSLNLDFLYFKIGRDRQLIGYGNNKILFGDNSQKFDYISMYFNYDIFSVSYFHGKLLGNLQKRISIDGPTNIIDDKYAAFHRIGFNFSRHFNLGLGETVIYSNRSPELSYLNPFNFYKSIEHSNQDRDNANLFIDFSNNTISGLKFYSMLMIDDIKFSKIGSGWYGNQTLWNFGMDYYTNSFPADFHIQFLRIEPYVFSHRIISNNFTNLGSNLGFDVQPNSEVFFSEVNYRINFRTNVSFNFLFIKHGANPLDANGNTINVGGNINLGHRIIDSEAAKFLDGEHEYERTFGINFMYEPFNNIFIKLNGIFKSQSLQNFVNKNYWQVLTNLSFKI